MAGDNLKLKGKIEEFYLQLIPILQRFPKTQRYTLAETIEKETLMSIKLVLDAEYNKNSRLESLQRLRTTLHTITILLRVSSRSNLLQEAAYEQLCRTTSELGKITSGWIKNESSPQRKISKAPLPDIEPSQSIR